MIKQNKGKTIDKIAKSKLISLDTKVIFSTKFDGNYIQIHKKEGKITFFTSGGKEFYFVDFAKKLLKIPHDFIVEAEYLSITKGKLGARVHCSTGHFRSQFTKGIECNLGNGSIKVFDLLDTDMNALTRMEWLDLVLGNLVVEWAVLPFSEAKAKAKQLSTEGWEGAMVKTTNHMYQAGKRTNDIIKLKYRPEAILKCVWVVAGKGKYADKIGSLLLQDKFFLTVNVGSGLTDEERGYNYDYFIGKDIEIEYEQKLATYIQPIFKRVL